MPRAVHQPKKRKGKGKAAQRSDAEFEKERAWLVRKLQDDATANAEDDDVEEGEGFECGCCFSTYPFVRTAHLSRFASDLPLFYSAR